MSDRIERAARWLVRQHRDHAVLGPFPADCAPADVAEAYAVQRRLVEIKARDCGPPVGWKIALSNPAMQRFVGLPEPIAGRLLKRQVVGGPARTTAAAYGRFLVEFEIAVELGADLPVAAGTVCSPERAAEAVAAVRPAFELADDRGADYATLSAHGLQLVADNALSEGAVLGERRSDWRSLDLKALRGTAYIDGEAVGQGEGRDLMGGPLEALAWLATHAARQGQPMRAGEVAILGSLVTSKFPTAGQRLRFELDGFAPLELAVD